MKDKAKIAALKAQPVLIPVGDGETPVHSANGRKFSRQELCRLLACDDVEVVFLPGTGLVLVVDAMGKYKFEQANPVATALWHALAPAVRGWDYVAGPCVVGATKTLAG